MANIFVLPYVKPCLEILVSALTPLELFKALSDETRLSIILLLREAGELCVCDLCAGLQESQPKISRHLALLRETGLLLDRRQGKWIHYRLSPHVPAWCAAVVEQAWLSQRHAVAAVMNRLGHKRVCE